MEDKVIQGESGMFQVWGWSLIKLWVVTVYGTAIAAMVFTYINSIQLRTTQMVLFFQA